MEKHRGPVLCLGIQSSIQLKDRLACLEMVLCFHAWMNYGPFDDLYQDDVYPKIDECARDIGAEVVKKCARREGFHYKLQKFHDLFAHLVADIKQVGSGSVLHMGVVERMHKFFAKIPACTSQFRGELTFMTQVSDRLRESQILTQARYMYQANVDLPMEANLRGAENCNENNPPAPPKKMMSAAASIAVSREANNNEPEYKWLGKGALPHGIHPMVVSAINEAYKMAEDDDDGTNIFQLDPTGLDKNYINLYTEASVKNHKYRCHPDYRQNGGWYDWAMVGWDVDPTRKDFKNWQPAQPFWQPNLFRYNAKPNEFVLDTSSHMDRPEPSLGSVFESEIEGGFVIFVPARILGFLKETVGGRVWAVVHSCRSFARTNSLLTRRWQLGYHHVNRKPTIQLVLATTLACPVFIIEEVPGLKETKPESDLVYEVSNRRLHWAKIFLHMAKVGVNNFVPSRVNRTKKAAETNESNEETPSNRTPINENAAKQNQPTRGNSAPPAVKTKRTANQSSGTKVVSNEETQSNHTPQDNAAKRSRPTRRNAAPPAAKQSRPTRRNVAQPAAKLSRPTRHKAAPPAVKTTRTAIKSSGTKGVTGKKRKRTNR